MHADHYAVVIGISSYPNLGDPPPADLKGPAFDAASVAAWLTDPGPGGLPPANVRLIRSADWNSPPTAAPGRDDIHKQTFLWLDSIAEANQKAGNRRIVGSRLYVYVSGHGFSPRFRQGCLLAGDAAERQYSANVFPSAWVEWLQDAGYFREFVLLMDCCMDRQILTQPTPPPLDPISVNTPPGPSFIAFAATRPLKAVEKQIPEDGQSWHGIFTWNLLQGLRGAARNAFGNVTGRSLADWLRQAQLGWLDAADRQSPDISKEPAIIDQDDGLILVRGVPPLQFDVTLRFPDDAACKQARLWSGQPPKPGAGFVIAAGGAKLSLAPGLYLVEVTGGGLRQGFAVTRSGEIAITEQGDAPAETTGTFPLTVDPQDATAEIRIVDSGFRVVENGSGSLTAQLPTGLFQFRIRIGRQIVEKVILLDSPWPKPAMTQAQALPVLPTITSAAPLPNTRATHEYQQAAASEGVDRIDINAGSGAQLMVMARCFSATGTVDHAARPWDGVKVLDATGRLVADMTTAGEHRANPGQDPTGVCGFSLDPGNYILQYRPGREGAEVAQSLVLPPGEWRLEAYVLRTLDGDAAAAKPRISLLMHRKGTPWGSGEDLLLEKARVALADENPILNAELSNLLLHKFQNPLAGIIGGHLMLLGHKDKDPAIPLDDLNEVVSNLRTLVGSEHPDVEALSLSCPDANLRRKTAISAAPLFERSWQLLIEASQRDPVILPLALWQQVHATLATPPFLIWAVGADVQNQFRRALAEAVFGQSIANLNLRSFVARPFSVTSILSTTVSAATELASAGRDGLIDGIVASKEWKELAQRLGVPPQALRALVKEFMAKP